MGPATVGAIDTDRRSLDEIVTEVLTEYLKPIQ